MEERIIVADPVAQPQEYQRELLALLGDRDPLQVLANTPLAVRKMATGVPGDLLRREPEPAEWSATGVLGHLWDSEIVFAFRARAILGQRVPTLAGYDQDAWAVLARPPFGEMLDAFTALRSANLHLARATPGGEWDRYGVHEERGPMSFRLFIDTMAGHDRAHVRQLEETLEAVRRNAG